MKLARQDNNFRQHPRRLFSALILAPGVTCALGAVQAQAQNTASASHAAPSPFGPLKYINAGLLDMAYAETGPADAQRPAGGRGLRKPLHRQYQLHLINGGIGKTLPQEAPQAFAQAVIDADHL